MNTYCVSRGSPCETTWLSQDVHNLIELSVIQSICLAHKVGLLIFKRKQGEGRDVEEE